MTPIELRDLLRDQLPGIAGVARTQDWEERPYGLAVQLDGRQDWVCWMVTGASGVAPAADGQEQPQPVAVPGLSAAKMPLGALEQALLAVAVTAPGVVRWDRYSTRPAPPAVGFGATIDCEDSWRLFLSVAGTKPRLVPGERLRSVAAGSEL
ncbi:hypothetical protein [Streptacidiphilus sp. MAP5-52]|uniref:hypothetical protein n=1 Tax=Streptacidiphilus sp. MAP5-52 TaxID=3156267 RepID=UPI0035187450